MNTFTIEELDREEVELLPSRVVMCASSPCCCRPTIQVCFDVGLCCIGTTAVVTVG